MKKPNITLCFLATILLLNKSNAQLKVMPNGNVGIGTSTAYNTLDVVGNSIFKSTQSGYPTSCAFIRGNSNYSNSSNPDYSFANDVNTGFSHTAQGIVEYNSQGYAVIGFHGISNDQFDVYGNGIAWQWKLHSDKRLKKNILKIDSALDKIIRLNGYSYEFDKSSFTKYDLKPGKQLGFIAQEVQLIFPELISTDNNGYLSMNYDGMIPVLLEAIKELKLEVETLKTQIKK